jgi:hypothetical protein
MECPFCAEQFNFDALVCKNCGRDLRLVRPLIGENLLLLAQIEDLQLPLNSARAALARSTAPIKFWFVHLCIYVFAPIILLIAAHFLITIVLDISPLYLRILSMLIPLPFGFFLLWFSHYDIRWSVLEGTIIGIVSVTVMLTVIAFLDNVPILPQDSREWRETLEYIASIALAEITGAAIAVLARRMVPRTLVATGAPGLLAILVARMIGRHVGDPALHRRAQKIQNKFRTIAAAAVTLALGGGSIYTGIRALLRSSLGGG